MSDTFEQSQPGHMIIEKQMPSGHAYLDQKLDKGMRSPMAGQLPTDAGQAMPEIAPGLSENQGGM